MQVKKQHTELDMEEWTGSKLEKEHVGLPGGSEAKRLPAVPETWVPSLGRKDPLEKEMATHSSALVWKIPCLEERGRLQSMELQRVGHD